ncbi:MAG: hypothetical protein HOG79_00300, partial [Prolixibacteraceae bacterium]|nr:hypothetical protein [Prolixibacteraceae bacterium]
MKTIRNLIFLHLLILVHLQLNAQQTAYFSDVQKEIVIAKELFGHGKFNAAFRRFEKIQNDVNEKSELFSEAEFFKSVSALKAGHSSGSKMVNKFINDFPESPYNNRA